jgi:hypothetical protein
LKISTLLLFLKKEASELDNIMKTLTEDVSNISLKENGELSAIKTSEKLRLLLHANKWDSKEEIF